MSVVVGLTGQSGAGKTTVSRVFEENGFGVINCDLIARRVTEDGSDCNRELSQFFPLCFDKDLHLDRAAMAKIVFSDKEKLGLLNSVIFKYINEEIGREIERLSESHAYILLDAPTLFEAGADKLCHYTVAVIAQESIRLKRITVRDRLDEQAVKKRFSSQHDEKFFKENCGYLITNDRTPKEAAEETVRIIKIIKERENGKYKT
ncbi:MAG: dephospho-CoA kinase [Ruminococcus sp.]|nr:dephospho-CoA kinase [Ruminococcus sp.]